MSGLIPPPDVSPKAYDTPFTTATRRWLRAIGIDLFVVQVFVQDVLPPPTA